MSKDGQYLLCKCGARANCFITDEGWMCKECFDNVIGENKEKEKK